VCRVARRLGGSATSLDQCWNDPNLSRDPFGFPESEVCDGD